MIGAVVLAAGRSQRMGRPKMILPWGDTTVIRQVVSVLRTAGVADVVVVTGGARREVEAQLSDLPVRALHNPDFANGEMLLSLQMGLAALSTDAAASLVVLGDQPQIECSVVRSVLTAFEPAEPPLVVPSYQMRRGHPWLVKRCLWPVLLGLQPPATLRQFLKQSAAEIVYVNVNTPSILQDLDTPADYARYQFQ